MGSYIYICIYIYIYLSIYLYSYRLVGHLLVHNFVLGTIEVKFLRKEMGLAEDAQMAELDAYGIKKLFSHGVKRLKTRANTSDSSLQSNWSFLSLRLRVFILTCCADLLM